MTQAVVLEENQSKQEDCWSLLQPKKMESHQGKEETFLPAFLKNILWLRKGLYELLCDLNDELGLSKHRSLIPCNDQKGLLNTSKGEMKADGLVWTSLYFQVALDPSNQLWYALSLKSRNIL